MTRKKNPEIEERALKIFEAHGGILRANEAIKQGIHPRTLYALKAAGRIEQLQKGLYCLPNLPGHTQPDLVTVAKKIPTGIICLISALFFHGLTTQIPHFVYLAVKKGYKPPRVDHPPVHFYWLSSPTYDLGVEKHILGGVEISCYSKEKTIVDCFKFRNKVGIDVAIEALKKYWQQGHPKLDLLLQFAKISRVEKVMKPYIEAILHET